MFHLELELLFRFQVLLTPWLLALSLLIFFLQFIDSLLIYSDPQYCKLFSHSVSHPWKCMTLKVKFRPNHRLDSTRRQRQYHGYSSYLVLYSRKILPWTIPSHEWTHWFETEIKSSPKKINLVKFKFISNKFNSSGKSYGSRYMDHLKRLQQPFLAWWILMRLWFCKITS